MLSGLDQIFLCIDNDAVCKSAFLFGTSPTSIL